MQERPFPAKAGKRHGALTGAALTFALTAGLPPVAAAPAPKAAAKAMCLDVGNTRNNGDKTVIWECGNNTNQRFVLANGQIKVEDTIGKSREMCLDAGGGRSNSDRTRIWQCVDHTNQKWVLQRGYIKVADTI
ncbi:ricin-type beta-trefoil lectin domain protein [Streptomyces sp. NPDC058155]|uniref:ricin-type beta-trefoil lectin domain protein n=1 Tax=Streptomyces sp. NPDC058155 TaxID=3346359 RepID=UPI0036EDEE0D